MKSTYKIIFVLALVILAACTKKNDPAPSMRVAAVTSEKQYATMNLNGTNYTLDTTKCGGGIGYLIGMNYTSLTLSFYISDTSSLDLTLVLFNNHVGEYSDTLSQCAGTYPIYTGNFQQNTSNARYWINSKKMLYLATSNCGGIQTTGSVTLDQGLYMPNHGTVSTKGSYNISFPKSNCANMSENITVSGTFNIKI